MLDKKAAFDILGSALAAIENDMAEAVLESERLSLTRFAESGISDNIDTEEKTLYLRIARDNKIGVIATGDISPEGIRQAVENCQAMLGFMMPDDNFESFAAPDEAVLEENFLVAGTTSFGPRKRAEAIDLASKIAGKGGFETSGAFRIESSSLAVANTLGIRRFFHGNHASFSLTVSGEKDNSGWAMEFNRDAAAIDINRLARTATMKAARSREPIALPDGQYTVILEPAAVGQLLLLLSFLGFGCKTLHQRRSFMAGQIGEKIAGDNFTVSADPHDPDFNFRPFDYEGVPRRSVELITDGIARGVVYNTYYANLMKTSSTGHALPPTNNFGPYPKTLSVAPGKRSLERIIETTEKGILITHFWYLNYLNPMRTMVTGTTQDGTFLIENGNITSAVKNMRTNQSILEAFSGIEAVSADRIIYPQFGVLMKVPGMKIGNFNLITEEDDDSKC